MCIDVSYLPSVLLLSCRLWLRPTQKRQTSIQPQGKHATWNESFHLPVEVVTQQKLVVVLLDHDTIGSDDELGRLVVDMNAYIAWYKA